jgi:hypothetical protein
MKILFIGKREMSEGALLEVRTLNFTQTKQDVLPVVNE